MHFLRSNFHAVDSTEFRIFFLSNRFSLLVVVALGRRLYCDLNLWMRLLMYSGYCVCEMGDNDMRMHIRNADDKPENNKNVFAVAFDRKTLGDGV